MTDSIKKPPGVYFLIAIMSFQAISGIYGGVFLILDPTGKMLQIPVNWLENSPFNNYLIPGIILLLVLGVLPMIVTFGLLKKLWYAWFGSLLVSLSLLVWLLVEVLIIGYHSKPPLQILYGIVALSLLTLTLLPSTKKYYN